VQAQAVGLRARRKTTATLRLPVLGAAAGAAAAGARAKVTRKGGRGSSASPSTSMCAEPFAWAPPGAAGARANSTACPGKLARRCAASRKVSLKSMVPSVSGRLV